MKVFKWMSRNADEVRNINEGGATKMLIARVRRQKLHGRKDLMLVTVPYYADIEPGDYVEIRKIDNA